MWKTHGKRICCAAALILLVLAILQLRSGIVAQESKDSSEPLLILYSGSDFSGRSLEVHDSLVDLPVIENADGTKFDWNDEIFSIEVVSGTWRLFQHGRCNTELDATPLEAFVVRDRQKVAGWTSLVSATSRGSLRLSSPEKGGLHRDISSIELVSSLNLPDWVYRR